MTYTTSSTSASTDEQQLMARIAAAIWASIGAFGLLGTLEPLRTSAADVESMRVVAGVAGVIAGALFIVPVRLMPRWVFSVMLVAMTAGVGALSFLGGSDRGDLTIMFTFIVVFSAYFFSGRISLIHLGLIGALLTSRLFVVDGEDAIRIETIRFTILAPALVSVWALVSLLRKNLADREFRLRAQETYDLETGALGANGFDQTLDVELARCVRHARPLSVVEVEASGPAFAQADDETIRRVATAIARTLVGRIRGEDRAARLGRLKFAVLAVETSHTGAAVLAGGVAKKVRSRLLSLGYEGDSFRVAVGWADYHQTNGSKEALMGEVESSLASAVPVSDGIALPQMKSAPPPPVVTDVSAAT
jgi:GGDEF domain-containing protein